MRLSEWRAGAPSREAMAPKVLDALARVLAVLGSEPDPSCWVAWGDDPATRYAVLVPTPAGLITANVRVNIPGEGPRASGKLVRWKRVAVSDLAVETQAGHSLVSISVEGTILHGADADAETIGAFLQALYAAEDGRATLDVVPSARRRTGGEPGARVVRRPEHRQGAGG